MDSFENKFTETRVPSEKSLETAEKLEQEVSDEEKFAIEQAENDSNYQRRPIDASGVSKLFNVRRYERDSKTDFTRSKNIAEARDANKTGGTLEADEKAA